MILPQTPIDDIPASPAIEQVALVLADVVQILAGVGVVVLSVAILLCLVRLVRGPHLADRAIALDVIGVQFVGVVILITMLKGTLLYVDGILIIALLSFAGTIAAAQFVARPHVVRQSAESEPEPDTDTRDDAEDGAEEQH